LENLNPLNRKSLAPDTLRDAVLEELRSRLEARGYQVDVRVGQSRFRCDLAVRDARHACYQLGILLDSELHYQNSNLVERYLMQPSVLREFGWKVVMVLIKDWFHEPDAVLDRLERAMKNTQSEPEAEEVPTLPATADGSNAESSSNSNRTESVSEASLPVQPLGSQTESSGREGLVRRFEFVGGNSRKFWEIAVGVNQLTINFGRIGSRGQQQIKPFAEEAKARREGEKLIAEKLKKGYREVSALKERLEEPGR